MCKADLEYFELMITIVKNTRGYNISVINAVLSVLCVAVTGYLVYVHELQENIVFLEGFILCFVIVSQSVVLLLLKRSPMKLKFAHGLFLFIAALSLIGSVIYVEFLGGLDSIKSSAFMESVHYMMVAQVISAICGLVLAFKIGRAHV